MTTHNAEYYLERTLSESPSDIAHFLKYLYYPYIRFDTKNWYSFSNHKWHVSDEDDSPLIPIIKNDLVNQYLRLASNYNDRTIQKNRLLSKYLDEDPQKMVEQDKEYLPLIISDLTNKSRLCSSISLQLNEPHFYQKINDSAKKLFNTKNFHLRLDQKPHLFGFNNCIYNLETHGIDVPSHAHSVLLSTGYDFFKESIHHKEVMQFFNALGLTNLLPDLAPLLLGVRRQPLIWINGLNEDSCYAIIQLLQWALGDYLGHLPFADLRRRKIPSSHSHTHSELIDNCKRRIVIVEQNPEDHPSVFAPMVDLLLSSKSLNLRKPREIDNDYHPQFGMIVLSRKPDAEPMEGALVYDATPKENIQAKEEWKLDMIKILLSYLKPDN